MAEVIRMPRLSDSMMEGEIVAWHKNVGDNVEKGDLLAEINSDKATMDFESPRSGSVLFIGAKAGDKLEVDSILAVIGKPGEAFQELIGAAPANEPPKVPISEPTSSGAAPAPTKETPQAPISESSSSGAVQTPVQGTLASQPTSTATSSTEAQRIKASPLAKSIASNAGIVLSNVQGSGDNGRITKKDVEAVISKPVPAAAPSSPNAPKAAEAIKASPATIISSFGADSYEDVPLSSMRKIIAKRVSDIMFTAPHFYVTVEINMDRAIELRKKVNELAAPLKVSFNDIVVKAAAAALRNHPAINSSWMGDFIRKNHSINIGVAVAVGENLFMPVVRNADMKTLTQISGEVKTMAGKAKEGKLSLPEMQGNTFSISNLGMFEIEEFTAIINAPDSCILAVGSIIQKPIVKEGQVIVGNMMKVTLSCDHRVVDGATGAQYLQTLKAILEEPIKLLV